MTPTESADKTAVELDATSVLREAHEGMEQEERTTEDLCGDVRDSIRKYPDLTRRIANLRRFADPLHREAGVLDPLIALVDDIRILPTEDELERKSPREISSIRRTVDRYEEELKSISYEYVKRTIAKPKDSIVFEILNNSNLFADKMRRSIGKKVTIDGHEQEITPEFVDALTKFNFSIGTPPITPKGIETIEQIMFGGTIRDVAGFSELLAADRFKIQQFVGLAGRLAEQSTRYTTKADREVYKLETRKFQGLKGGRSLTKAIVNNGMAEDLIRGKLIGRNYPDPEEQPLEVIDKTGKALTKQDVEEISELMLEQGNRKKLFVVKVSHLPESFFTPSERGEGKMHREWEGIIGRLIIIEEPKTAVAASTSTVYSMHPEVTEALQGWHTKSLGTPASTQMNLRLMLEGFNEGELAQIGKSIDELTAKLRKEIATTADGKEMSADYSRRRTWIVTAQKDLKTLLRFREFLAFVIKIKEISKRSTTGDVEKGMHAENSRLRTEIEKLAKDYFGGSLKKSDQHDWICHGSGGGRGGLGVVEDWLRKKHEQDTERYKTVHFNKAQEAFAAIQAEDLIPEHSTYVTEITIANALRDRRGPSAALVEDEGEISPAIQISAEDKVRHLLSNVEGFADKVIQILDRVTGKNVPGVLQAGLKSVLAQGNIDAVAKIFEREPYSQYSAKYRKIVEATIGGLRSGVEKLGTKVQKQRAQFEVQNFSFPEKIIGEMSAGTFRSCIIVPDQAWSYDDIYDDNYYNKSEFPVGNYIRIKTKDDGSLDWYGLKKRLETWEKQCILLDERCMSVGHNGDRFQNLFKTFCGNMTLLDNSPRNPTATVDSTEDRKTMLDIASRFGITIVSDAAYHKLVSKDIKDEEGDYLTADLQERYPERYPTRAKIITVLPSTKWAMGGGRRTSMIISNDKDMVDGHSLRDHVAAQTKGENTMSLYMDKETYRTGLAVKESCQVVEESILTPFKSLANALKDFSDQARGFAKPASMLARAKQVPGIVQSAKVALETMLKVNKNQQFNTAKSVLRELTKTSIVKSLSNIQDVIDRLYDAFVRDFETAIDSLISEKHNNLEDAKTSGPVYFKLVEMRNTLHRLRIREATWPQLMAVMNDFVKDLKELRLDKQTQKDTLNRVDAAKEAIKSVEEELGITIDYMEPEGPFYFFMRVVDKKESPADLDLFLPAIARFIKVDPVPKNGYVRYGLGGELDGSQKGYELFQKAIAADIKILLKFWNDFKKNKAYFKKQIKEGKIDPSGNDITALALAKTFPVGDKALEKVVELKGDLAREIMEHETNSRGNIVDTDALPIDVHRHIAKISPNAPTSVVTIKNFTCQDTASFVLSRPFQELYSYYLSLIFNKIPEFAGLTLGEVLKDYNADMFAARYDDRRFRDSDKAIFAKIIHEISKVWYSDANFRTLSHRIKPGKRSEARATLDGFESRMQQFMGDIAAAFSLSDEQKELMTSQANFHVAYSPVNPSRLEKENDNLPGWLNTAVKKSELVEFNSPTNPSSTRETLSTARVAGHDRGIFKRDGDGKKDPPPAYFRNRLEHFTETMDESQYVCKLIQVGPVKNLIIMQRSYLPDLADEIRLMPQSDLSFKDIKQIEPDAVSFLGIPEKVMGEDYRVGYYFDEKKDGSKMPVSWVDREHLTNYMGYLKKPILSACNEAVEAWGGKSIHGAAFTITTTDGLRKTFVAEGDSGAGKSETIVAMMEQVVAGLGGAENIEEISILAGDMLSLFYGDDGQVYMFGTEEGDFMRMTDIPTNWQELRQDLLRLASRTNIGDANERATVGGLVPKGETVKLTRVNGLINVNNFEEPPGPAMQRVEDKYHFIMKELMRGYRKEKGTSGDQPNLYASVRFSEQSDRFSLENRYGDRLDQFLGWEVIVNEANGKPKNAILSFRDIKGGMTEAKTMVRDLFQGKTFEYRGEQVQITETAYKPYESKEIQNRFYVTIQNSEGVEQEIPIDREVFDAIYEPVVSTLGGHPFVHPDHIRENLINLAKTISEDPDFLTFTLYTRIAVPGQEFSGANRAAEDMIETVLTDQVFNTRFKRHRETVAGALQDKYGDTILGHGEFPKWLQRYNLELAEKVDTEAVRLVKDPTVEKSQQVPISIETKGYKYVAGKAKAKPQFTLITDKMKSQIQGTMNSDGYKAISFEEPEIPADLSTYQGIHNWDSDEELIYQVLVINGAVDFRSRHNNFDLIKDSVREAEYIAGLIKERGKTKPPHIEKQERKAS